jgi:hypothetical protein
VHLRHPLMADAQVGRDVTDPEGATLAHRPKSRQATFAHPRPPGLGYAGPRDHMKPNRRGRPSRRLRFDMLALVVFTAMILPSCGDSPKKLGDVLDSFPAPSHLVVIQAEESGSSLSIFRDNPKARRYFVTEQPPERTCADVQEAIGRWDTVDEVRWVETYEDEDYPCRASGMYGGASFSMQVLNPDLFTSSEMGRIPPADRDHYRSAVALSLEVPP